MILTFDTRIILLLHTLFQGLAGLRLNKISIPAYKLRGESAFLECQYELNKANYVASSNSRHQHNQHGAAGGAGTDLNYVDTDSATAAEVEPVYRRIRTRPYELQQLQQQQQQRRYQQQQQQQRQSYHYLNARGGGGRGAASREDVYQTQHQTQASALYAARSNAAYGNEGASRRRQAYEDSVAAGARGGGAYGAGTYAGGRRVSGSNYDGGGAAFNVAGDGGDERDVSRSVMIASGEESNGEEEGEALYAVKWYKDNEEFYRYVPKANPPKQSYRVDGIRVIEEHSDSTRVLLRGLTLNSTGMYRCEVSAEAPNFSSVQGEGRMDVVYLPRDGPHIKGQQFQYQIGEMLSLNCTSGKSHPASHLQWFINEQPVVDSRFLVRYNDTVHKHGLITATLGLQLTVDARHFLNGAMKVKCLASISPVLWKGGRESVLQRRPGIIDNREAMLLVRSTAVGRHQLQHNLSILAFTFLLSKLSQLLQSTLR